MRSPPLDMPGDGRERGGGTGVCLGVLLRTTDWRAAANAGDDMSGGDLRDGVVADETAGGGGGGAGGAAAGENGLAEQ
jgi:hypothetical protein